MVESSSSILCVMDWRRRSIVCSILLLFLSSPCIYAKNITTQCSKGAHFSGNYSNGGTWMLWWNIDCDANNFDAKIYAQAAGWVGFGLNTAESMAGADVLQVAVKETGETLSQNGHATGPQPPTPLSTSVYQNVTGVRNVTDQSVTFTFQRNLTVLDSWNRTLSSSTYLLWAFQSSSQSFSQFHYNNKAVVGINFFTGEIKTVKPVNYSLIHGILMLLAWGFAAPLATFVARYLKFIGHLWYQVHSATQYAVLIIVAAAFVLIEYHIGPGFRNHFKSKHSIIGAVVVGVLLLQICLGILSNCLFKPNRGYVPWFPDRLHWWLGRSVLVLASVNIFLGFNLYEMNTATFIAYGAWLGVTLVTVLFMEFTHGQINHVNAEYKALNGEKETPSHRIPVFIYMAYVMCGFVLFIVCAYQMYSS